jgi:hypothetical protein
MPHLPSKAIIACDGKGNGCVLFYIGDGITEEIETGTYCSIDELGLDKAPFGLSVWEGEFVACVDEYEPENYTKPEGSFRELTEAEWKAVKDKQNPWTLRVVNGG